MTEEEKDLSAEAVKTMDWSCFKDKPITQTCSCRCGAEYRTHAKINMDLRRSVPLDPCPGCGRHDNIRRTSDDPELWTLG